MTSLLLGLGPLDGIIHPTAGQGTEPFTNP